MRPSDVVTAERMCEFQVLEVEQLQAMMRCKVGVAEGHGRSLKL